MVEQQQVLAMKPRGLRFAITRAAGHRHFQESFGLVRQKMRQGCGIADRNAGDDPVGARAVRTDQRRMTGKVSFDENSCLTKLFSIGVRTPTRGRLIELPIGQGQNRLTAFASSLRRTAAEKHGYDDTDHKTIHGV